MPLEALGINHNAPINVREKVAFSESMLPEALSQLCQAPAVNEAVILSTCHRTEIYCEPHQPGHLLHWLSQHCQLPLAQLTPHIYHYENAAAVQHLTRVACGLDSVVLGETQIFGQLKRAFASAQDVGSIGPTFARLFPAIFSSTKLIRQTTQLNCGTQSIATMAVQLAKKIFNDLGHCSLLCIGSGETIRLATKQFAAYGIADLTIAGRTVARARHADLTGQAHCITLDNLPNVLPKADIVVSATAARLPILGKGLLETALHKRKHRPMLLLDLAMPRDIEPEISKLPDAYLYNLDDMNQVIQNNQKRRQDAAHSAEDLVNSHTAHTIAKLRGLDANQTITAFRQHVQSLKQTVLTQHQKTVLEHPAVAQQLDILLNAFTNKLLHAPCQHLRQACQDEQTQLLHSIQRLFDLEP